MQPALHLTLDEARFISLVAQRLDGLPKRPRGPVTKQDILETIEAIGCVQLDTISVVARSHETVLWSRLGVFDPALFNQLHYPDAILIEYWAHAAAIAPRANFRYFLRAMQRHHHDEPSNAASWAAENKTLLTEVLQTLAERGPSPSRIFEHPDGPRPTPWTWYGGKPAKRALDALWTSGELIIQQRLGFERVYELTDRAFPGLRDEAVPSIEEDRRHFVSTALRAMGIGTAPWISDYFRGGSAHVSVAQTALELTSLARDGLAVPASVEGLTRPAWLDVRMVETLEAFRAGAIAPKRTTLLSPFDSLIWNRARALALFGFEYRIECYTPAEKRRYGYYTLPILHRGKLVGRIDPVYKRQERRLMLRSVHLEPGVRATRGLAVPVAKAVRSYVDFLGGGVVEIGTGGHGEFSALLERELANTGGENGTNDSPTDALAPVKRVVS